MATISGYELSLLGCGQFGDVLLVRRVTDRKLFAAKVPHGDDDEARQTSRLEAQLLARLRHANIVQCVETVEDGRQLAIVMEYTSGGDLDGFLRSHQDSSQSRLSESAIMRIFIQIALALEYLHDHRVLHRDLKPKNILLDGDGIVKLSDFGVAKVLQSPLDAAHTVIGTPHYMAPELLEGNAYDSKSDVWSLGCVLYELATYSPPFPGTALGTVVYQILHNEPAAVPPPYSAAFQALVLRLLEKQPQKRPDLPAILSSEVVLYHMRQLVSVATSHQPMLLDQLAALGRICQPIQQPTPKFGPVEPSGAVSQLPTRASCPNLDGTNGRARWNTPQAPHIGQKAKEQREVAGRERMERDRGSARQLFFENQAAARRNKERVDQERTGAAAFLEVEAMTPLLDARPTRLQQLPPSSSPRNDGDRRVHDEENTRPNRRRLLADLGHGDDRSEQEEAPGLPLPPPAPMPKSPQARASPTPERYEELLDAERRRVRLETKALHERMRALQTTE